MWFGFVLEGFYVLFDLVRLVRFWWIGSVGWNILENRRDVLRVWTNVIRKDVECVCVFEVGVWGGV